MSVQENWIKSGILRKKIKQDLLLNFQIKNLSSDPVRHDNGNDKNINESDDDSREDATDDIVIEEEDSKANVQLQDQGWAWMVVLGSFWSHLITGNFV